MAPDTRTPEPVLRATRRGPLALLARLLIGLLLAVGSTVLLPQAALAASPSLGWFGSGGSNGLGRWTVGTIVVYCVDPLYGSEGGSNGTSYFLGAGDWLNHYGPRHPLTATELARLNWAIDSYGEGPGSDANTKRWAAAVQLYVWSITAPDVYADPGNPAWHGGTRVGSGNGDAWFSARILLHGGSAADRTAVLNRLAQLRAEDDAVTAAVPAIGGGIAVTDDAVLGDDGYVISRSGLPVGVEYSVTLGNARFPDGSTTKMLTGGGTTPIIALPPARAEGTGYTIMARLSYTRIHWPDRLRLWKPAGGQRVATGERLSRSYSATGSFAVGPVLTELFAPVLGTTAPRLVLPGEAFDDEVSFAAGEHGGNPTAWPFDGETGRYLPVTATGALYGPYAGRPAEAAAPPADAQSPVAVVTIATSAERGPGAYSVAEQGTLVEGSLTATEAGFYSWVWELDAADQSVEVRERLPDNYLFRDAFGQTAETSIVAMRLEATTTVTESEVALGAPIQDVLTVTGDGLWLEDEGDPIPVVFRGTAYFQPGLTPPVVDPDANSIPANAEEVGTTTLTVTGPGRYTSDGDAVHAPDEGEGYVVWRWAIHPEDQPEEYRGWVADWADLFGLANETQRLLRPEVTTRAQEDAAVGERFTDTAIVTGTLPTGGAWLGFELYDAAAGEHAEPVWVSEPLLITAPGEYESPAAPGQLPGSYFWVETLTSVEDTDGDGERLISRGQWGLPAETTRVVAPDVTTAAHPGAPGQALSGATGGDADPLTVDALPAIEVPFASGIHDIATVSGLIPVGATTLSFEAYRVPVTEEPASPGGPRLIAYPEGITSGDLSWACTPENLAFASAPVHVTEPGEYRSETFVGAPHGLYLWTELLTVDLGEGPVELHRGACGLAEETSAVLDVTTAAHSDDPSGTNPAPELWDAAELVGWVPEGGSISFEAYRGRADAAPLCTADTLVHRSHPVDLVSGFYTPDAPLAVVGDRWRAPVDRLAPTRVHWVQSVVDALGREVSRGECGDPAETVAVPAPPLTETGLTTPLLTLGGVAAALAVAGVVLLAARRRAPR